MALEPQQLVEMYGRMLTIRQFDQRAVEEFHAGNIPGVVHAYIGQEAVAVGVCTALRRDDQYCQYASGSRPYDCQRRRYPAHDGRTLWAQQRLLPRQRRFHAHRRF